MAYYRCQFWRHLLRSHCWLFSETYARVHGFVISSLVHTLTISGICLLLINFQTLVGYPVPEGQITLLRCTWLLRVYSLHVSIYSGRTCHTGRDHTGTTRAPPGCSGNKKAAQEGADRSEQILCPPCTLRPEMAVLLADTHSQKEAPPVYSPGCPSSWSSKPSLSWSSLGLLVRFDHLDGSPWSSLRPFQNSSK